MVHLHPFHIAGHFSSDFVSNDQHTFPHNTIKIRRSDNKCFTSKGLNQL